VLRKPSNWALVTFRGSDSIWSRIIFEIQQGTVNPSVA